ncbi:MAG: hypothetical protein KDD64_07800 [Bdellovibrionales bacterium]|nr:hypothetical protein [Bdellovibrionales bacterium]
MSRLEVEKQDNQTSSTVDSLSPLSSLSFLEHPSHRELDVAEPITVRRDNLELVCWQLGESNFHVRLSDGDTPLLDEDLALSWNAGSVREASWNILRQAIEDFRLNGSVHDFRAILQELEDGGLLHRPSNGILRRDDFPEISFQGLNEEAELLKVLLHFNIPVLDDWGTGRARSFHQLYKELKAGETRLSREGDELVLKTRIARIDVFYRTQAGEVLHLIEDRQVYKDPGREVRRELDVSLGEKLLPNERTDEAAVRGIIEELFRPHVENNPTRRNEIASKLDLEGGALSATSRSSECYPGLRHDKVFSTFRVTLHKELFEPEGYIEHQSDKDTVFLWEPAGSTGSLRIAV